jgi:hypothetical protein
MATKRKSQVKKILKHLGGGRTLTVNEAERRFGVQRLSARIYDLRNDGFVIYTNRQTMKGGVNRGRKVTTYQLDYVDQKFVKQSAAKLGLV